MLLEVFSPQEIARILKISYDKALNFIKYSGIPYIKIGRQYRVTKENFEAFINSKESREIDISGVSDIYYNTDNNHRRLK